MLNSVRDVPLIIRAPPQRSSGARKNTALAEAYADRMCKSQPLLPASPESCNMLLMCVGQAPWRLTTTASTHNPQGSGRRAPIQKQRPKTGNAPFSRLYRGSFGITLYDTKKCQPASLQEQYCATKT